MKRTLCIITALVMCMIIAATTVAADVFVPSVTAKPAPDVVTGGQLEIEVVDKTDKTVATFEGSDVVVTPVADRNEANQDVKEALTNAYNTLSASNVQLDKVMPALAEIAAEKKVDVSELVIKDLFHVSVSEDVKQSLATDGNGLKLTFDAKITKNQFVAVMVLVDGEWVPVDFVVNADGTITCTMHVVGVVAIMVKP